MTRRHNALLQILLQLLSTVRRDPIYHDAGMALMSNYINSFIFHS